MGQNKGKRELYYLLTSAATHPPNKKARKKTEQTYAVIVAVAFGVAKEEGEKGRGSEMDRSGPSGAETSRQARRSKIEQ